jgi:DNA-binding transcriptional regulator YiaG
MTILKRLRDATGMSREEFARLTGVTLARLEKHEQGRHSMSLEDAGTYSVHLARALHTTPSKLLAELAQLPE